MRLTECKSAAGDPARARTTLRSAARHRRAAPDRSSGRVRPVGCICGLGARLRDAALHVPPSIPTPPEGALGTLRTFWIIAALLVRATDDPPRHHDTYRLCRLDERQHLGRNGRIVADVRLSAEPLSSTEQEMHSPATQCPRRPWRQTRSSDHSTRSWQADTHGSRDGPSSRGASLRSQTASPGDPPTTSARAVRLTTRLQRPAAARKLKKRG